MMSAKEDALTPAPVTTRTRQRTGASHAWMPWLGALAGAGLACLALGSSWFLPSQPRFDCRVTDGAGRSFDVSGITRALTSQRALASVGPADPAVEAARSRVRAHASELRTSPPGPLSQLAPAAECAALLRARADLARTLAGPEASSATSDAPEGAPLSNELAEADMRLERAALDGDPSGMRSALREAEAAEDRWLVSLQPKPHQRFEIWLSRELDRSSQFLIAADDLEALQTPYQRELVQQWLPQFTLELESGALSTLASMPGPGTVSAPRARWPVWALGIAAGALAGALLGLFVSLLLSVLARRAAPSRTTARRAVWGPMPEFERASREPSPSPSPAPEPASARLTRRTAAAASVRSAPASHFQTELGGARVSVRSGVATPALPGHGVRAVAPGPLLAPAVGDAWLHLVSAEDAPRVARAAGELAVPLLARARRVLVVEAGQRLKLHESFGCAPRWGVGECLSGELPLLGTVQRAGVRDLYLLAIGSYSGRGSCEKLGALLDEAHKQFSAVVVALDSRAGAEFRALAEGRRAEAWWPRASGRLSRAAVVFGERLGIPVTPFGLPPKTEHWLEALEGRVDALRAVLLPPRTEPLEKYLGATHDPRRPGAIDGTSLVRSAVARSTPVVARVTRPVAVDDPNSPTVQRPMMDEDERSRERLRFLLWMRQVRAERRKRQMTPVS